MIKTGNFQQRVRNKIQIVLNINTTKIKNTLEEINSR